MQQNELDAKPLKRTAFGGEVIRVYFTRSSMPWGINSIGFWTVSTLYAPHWAAAAIKFGIGNGCFAMAARRKRRCQARRSNQPPRYNNLTSKDHLFVDLAVSLHFCLCNKLAQVHAVLHELSVTELGELCLQRILLSSELHVEFGLHMPSG